MKYNQVRRGDGSIVNEEKVIIHSLGRLDWNIYDCISSNHITDEVIITEEQMMHIRERHPEAYTDTMHYVREILDDPDYIFRDKRPNTGLVVKKIFNDEESSLLVLKIITSDDNKDYKNSVLTSWKITEKRLNNYLRNKMCIRDREYGVNVYSTLGKGTDVEIIIPANYKREEHENEERAFEN